METPYFQKQDGVNPRTLYGLLEEEHVDRTRVERRQILEVQLSCHRPIDMAVVLVLPHRGPTRGVWDAIAGAREHPQAESRKAFAQPVIEQCCRPVRGNVVVAIYHTCTHLKPPSICVLQAKVQLQGLVHSPGTPRPT